MFTSLVVVLLWFFELCEISCEEFEDHWGRSDVWIFRVFGNWSVSCSFRYVNIPHCGSNGSPDCSRSIPCYHSYFDVPSQTCAWECNAKTAVWSCAQFSSFSECCSTVTQSWDQFLLEDLNDDWLSQEDFKKEYSNFHFQRFVPSARFTRHHYDAEIVDKLQDIIDNATEDEIETSRMQGCSWFLQHLHVLHLRVRPGCFRISRTDWQSISQSITFDFLFEWASYR